MKIMGKIALFLITLMMLTMTTAFAAPDDSWDGIWQKPLPKTAATASVSESVYVMVYGDQTNSQKITFQDDQYGGVWLMLNKDGFTFPIPLEDDQVRLLPVLVLELAKNFAVTVDFSYLREHGKYLPKTDDGTYSKLPPAPQVVTRSWQGY